MTAGVAGGVAGAVVEKVVLSGGGAFSKFEIGVETFTSCGGWGNRDSEKVEGVVCAPIDGTLSVDEVGVSPGGNGEFTDAKGVWAGGFGSLLMGFQ